MSSCSQHRERGRSAGVAGTGADVRDGLLAVPSTPEYKSLALDDTACKADSDGLLKRYPVTASAFHLIGKETERGWEQADDISTLWPSLIR